MKRLYVVRPKVQTQRIVKKRSSLAAHAPRVIQQKSEDKQQHARLTRQGQRGHNDPTSENYIPSYKELDQFKPDYKDAESRLYYVITEAMFPQLYHTLRTVTNEITDTRLALAILLPISITRQTKDAGVQDFPKVDANSTLVLYPTSTSSSEIQFTVHSTVFIHGRATGLLFVSI
jgi:hypothetical protein